MPVLKRAGGGIEPRIYVKASHPLWQDTEVEDDDDKEKVDADDEFRRQVLNQSHK